MFVSALNEVIDSQARRDAGIVSGEDERSPGALASPGRRPGRPVPACSEKLSGYDGLFRIRAGDYRIVYVIEDARAPASTMKLQIVVYQDEDGAWIAECPAVPGCVSQGASLTTETEEIEAAA